MPTGNPFPVSIGLDDPMNHHPQMAIPPAWLWRELSARDWTQADLVKRSGLSSGHVSRLMSGEREFGLDAYRSIARALRLSLEDLFRLAGVLPPLLQSAPGPLSALVERLECMDGQERDRMIALIMEYIDFLTARMTAVVRTGPPH